MTNGGGSPLFEGNRSYAKLRHNLIARTPALHERELAKLAALSDALATALKARGVATLRATLAAQAGVALAQVTIAWLDDPEPGLRQRLAEAAHTLSTLVAGVEGLPSRPVP